MIIYKKDIIKGLLFISLIIVLLITLFKVMGNNSGDFRIGGYIHKEQQKREGEIPQAVLNSNSNYNFYEERFQRPSKQAGLKLKYKFEGLHGKDFEYPEKYNTPVDIIHAYYSILKDASNMIGFHGGCGTIGMSRTPYPAAYELLSDETKKEISLEEFKNSFSGTGHITLLKLSPAYQPPSTPDNLRYYFVEVEIITGPPSSKDEEYKREASYFAYYYGIVTAEYHESGGWKIKSVDYIPEDFLCAPWHGWNWDSNHLVNTIYGNWYKLIDKIDDVEIKDSFISIYASGKNEKYRFDFVRLTNGVDVLLHEYIKINNKWKESNILKSKDQGYKLSVLKFNKEK